MLKGMEHFGGEKLQKPTQERTGKNRNNTKPRKLTHDFPHDSRVKDNKDKRYKWVGEQTHCRNIAYI